MPNTRDPAITPSMINDLKRQGYKQYEIAQMFGVSPSYISWIKRTKGGVVQTPREEVMEHFPWDVGVRFHDASPNKRMRDHAEFMATGGEGMSPDKLYRLQVFYRFLESENLVVEFDPDIPPMEGVSKVGGFAYRQRQHGDGDLIIRVNPYTTLTEDGKDLWVLPDPKLRKKLDLRAGG